MRMFGKDQSDWKDALKYPPAKALTKIREFFDRSTNNKRIEAMVGIGRLAADGKQEAQFIISKMRGGDFSERLLALHSCHGSRDGGHMLAAVADKSETIRAVARRLITKYGSDDETVEAFALLPRCARKSFLRQLRLRKRFEPLDRILAELASSDVQDFRSYLPYGSEDFVRKHWAPIEGDTSAMDWERLARNRREFASERLLQLLSTLDSFEPRSIWIANSVLALLAKNRVDATMNVVNEMLRVCSLNQIRLKEVVRAFPVAVAKICEASEDRANIDFYDAFDKLDSDLLIEIMRRYPPRHGIVKILSRLPVSTRRVVYENLAAAWRSDYQGMIDDGILEQMPADIREREAATHLAMDSLLTNPQLRMKYVPFLPFDKVKEFVRAPVSDPSPELRGVAWSALIGSVRFNKNEIAYVLEELKKKKREQDPVRQVIAQSLSMLPPSVFKEAQLADLSQLVKDALESRDLSSTTTYYFEVLILQLVPFYPAWASECLALFWRERGRASVPDFEVRINDQEAMTMEPAIAAVLKQWTKKEYEFAAVTTARLFGCRLKVMKQIIVMLEDIVLNSHNFEYADDAFEVLKNHAHSSLAELVPRMLKKDASWGTQPAVVDYLLKYRQDLLTPYLGQVAHRGRFSSGKRAVVPRLSNGLSRLSSEQLKIYAKSLNAMANDKDSHGYEKAFAVTYLSKIPSCPIYYLSQFIENQKFETYERHLAFTELSRLDEGQGIPVLLKALSDPDQAYAAIYTLRTSLMKMPGEQAFEILDNVSSKQITVEKEVVRLLGDIRYEPALQKVFKLANAELHRDVRVAVVGALWRNLDRAESWDILSKLIDDEEEAVAFAVIRTPSERLNSKGQKLLVGLLLRGLKHDAIRVRMKTLERLGFSPVNDSEMDLLDGVIDSLSSESQDECRMASRAILQLYGHTALSAFPKAALAVVAKRRNILTFVEQLETALISQRSKLAAATFATISALEADPLTLSLRARLAIASMPWGELTQWLEEMEAKQLLHPDLLLEIGNRLTRTQRRDVGGLEELELALAKSDSESLRRIALYALVAQSGTYRGWTEDRFERLEAFRNDRSPFIAEVAQFTLPAEEEALKAARR